MSNPINQAVSDIITDEGWLEIVDSINTERSRRNLSPISIDVTDDGGRTQAIDFNDMVDGINNIALPDQQLPPKQPNPGSCTPDAGVVSGDCDAPTKTLPHVNTGEIITWEDVSELQSLITEYQNSCICNTNTCLCNTDNCCACNCNYLVPPEDSHNEGCCTCNCNNSCTCNCNYDGSCACNCNFSQCPANYEGQCTCNSNWQICGDTEVNKCPSNYTLNAYTSGETPC